MLDRQSIMIELQGKQYTFLEPVRRDARRLQAGIVRLLPRLIELRQALANAGVKSANPTPKEMQAAGQNIDPEMAAKLFEFFDPVCDFLQQAIPEISDDVLDVATEPELVTAFMAIRGVVQAPLSRSGNGQPVTAPQKTPETPQPSTSEEPAPEPVTPTGNPEPTN